MLTELTRGGVAARTAARGGPADGAGTFAATFAALYAAHRVGDEWIQTHHQACTKGADGWAGRRACAGHVASYTAAQAIALAAVRWGTGAPITSRRAAAALTVSAVSHYVADRREPLRRLAEAMQPRFGKGDYYHLGEPRPGLDDPPTLGTGAVALDQAWHVGWLLVAALTVSADLGS